METYIKDPDADLDYGIDWTSWLHAGEAILTSTWSGSAGISTGSPELSDGVATIWLTGGEPGRDYRITNEVTTDEGRTDDRSFKIRVRER